VRRSAACLLLALALAGCAGKESAEPAVTTQAEQSRSAMEALIAFARSPGEATWAVIPLAESVELGLGETLHTKRSARELRQPGAWLLNLDLFRARAGTSSALELIAAEEGRLRVTHGPHPHCASPPVPPPPAVAALDRVVVQPAAPDGCLDWWTVDAFVNGDGDIEAVTLDLWEP